MVVDQSAVEACAIGVLICRGLPEDEAKALAKKITEPHPDASLVALYREVGSVILTLEAHGMLKRTTH